MRTSLARFLVVITFCVDCVSRKARSSGTKKAKQSKSWFVNQQVKLGEAKVSKKQMKYFYFDHTLLNTFFVCRSGSGRIPGWSKMELYAPFTLQAKPA